MNAVVDALAPLGVTHIDMPASPQRVWQAIQAASPRNSRRVGGETDVQLRLSTPDLARRASRPACAASRSRGCSPAARRCIPTLKQRLASPDAVIDLKGIPRSAASSVGATAL